LLIKELAQIVERDGFTALVTDVMEILERLL
jgi:hypothetical protein